MPSIAFKMNTCRKKITGGVSAGGGRSEGPNRKEDALPGLHKRKENSVAIARASVRSSRAGPVPTMAGLSMSALCPLYGPVPTMAGRSSPVAPADSLQQAAAEQAGPAGPEFMHSESARAMRGTTAAALQDGEGGRPSLTRSGAAARTGSGRAAARDRRDPNRQPAARRSRSWGGGLHGGRRARALDATTSPTMSGMAVVGFLRAAARRGGSVSGLPLFFSFAEASPPARP